MVEDQDFNRLGIMPKLISVCLIFGHLTAEHSSAPVFADGFGRSKAMFNATTNRTNTTATNFLMACN
ncbi:MAG TPA: hypothetical protein VF622_15860 [Segetibacter sp.]|jgi:hypothetical protein